MKKKPSGRILLLLLFMIFTFFSESIVYAAPRELTNVIENVIIYEDHNGRPSNPDSTGTYVLATSGRYSFHVDFNLKDYDNTNLQDGDYFTFTVPEPVTLQSTSSFELKDDASGIFIADVETTPRGKNKGGVVKITLKNLAAYKTKMGYDDVRGIRGDFFIKIDATELIAQQTINIGNKIGGGHFTIKYKIQKPVENDFSEDIAKENYAKVGGVVQMETINSPTHNYVNKKNAGPPLDYTHQCPKSR